MNVERKRKKNTSGGPVTKRARIYRPPPVKKGILGKTARAKLVYGAKFTLTPGAGGTVANHVFSANGCYDPDITGAGHQPRGFDQLMALYDHYVVKNSKIEVWAVTDATLVEAPGTIIQVSLRDGAATYVDYRDFIEYDFARRTTNKNVSKNGSYISYKANPNKFLGYRDSSDDPELKGNSGENPDEQAYWHVSAFAIGAAAPQVINLMARIEFDVELIEPKIPNVS